METGLNLCLARSLRKNQCISNVVFAKERKRGKKDLLEEDIMKNRRTRSGWRRFPTVYSVCLISSSLTPNRLEDRRRNRFYLLEEKG